MAPIARVKLLAENHFRIPRKILQYFAEACRADVWKALLFVHYEVIHYLQAFSFCPLQEKLALAPVRASIIHMNMQVSAYPSRLLSILPIKFFESEIKFIRTARRIYRAMLCFVFKTSGNAYGNRLLRNIKDWVN